MSAEHISPGSIALPEEWFEQGREADTERMAEITSHTIQQYQDYNVETINIVDDLSRYLGRKQEGTARIALGECSGGIIQTFAHEQGHDVCHQTCAETLENSDPLTERTFNELVADTNAWNVLNENETRNSSQHEDFLTRRNVFKDKYRGEFETLRNLLSIEDRKKELDRANQIKEHTAKPPEKINTETLKAQTETLSDQHPNLGNPFLTLGTDGTEGTGLFRPCFDAEPITTKINNLKRKANHLDQPHSLLRKRWYEEQRRKTTNTISEKTRELMSQSSQPEPDPEQILQHKSYEILTGSMHQVAKDLQSSINTYKKQIENKGKIPLAFDNIKQSERAYGARGGVDFEHETAGMIAQELHKNGYTIDNVIDKPGEYAKVCEQTIKYALDIGLELAEQDHEQWTKENTARYERELRKQINQEIQKTEQLSEPDGLERRC